MNTHLFVGRVFLEDTDALGITYHARYLQFAERARHEWLRSLGFSHQELIHHHLIAFVVRSCHIRFFQPLAFDDIFIIKTYLLSSSSYTLSLQQHIHHLEKTSSHTLDNITPHTSHLGKKSSKLLVELACINHQKKLCKPPELLLQKLSSQKVSP